MFDCTATLWLNNVPAEYHIFPLPNFGDPHFHKTITSYSSFRKRENAGLFNCQVKARKTQTPCVYPVIRASLKDKDDWDIDHRLLNESLAKYKLKIKPEPNWIRHESLWDVYKAIGYDFKTKRYIRAENCAAELSATVEIQMSKAVAAFERTAKRATKRCAWYSRYTRNSIEHGARRES